MNNNIWYRDEDGDRRPEICRAMSARRPIAKDAHSIVKTWKWDVPWKRTPREFLIRGHETTHLLIGTYEFYADVKGHTVRCWDVNTIHPTSWWERLSLKETASMKRTNAKSYLLRGWWQRYGRLSERGRIWRTTTVIP